MARADFVDLTLMVHHETDAAWLVSDDGIEKNARWVPKSQVELERLAKAGEQLGTGSRYEAIVTMPEWLAMDKGFV